MNTERVPLFTAIVLSYNNLQFITDALSSVFAQEHPRIELIISDDGSHTFSPLQMESYIAQHKSQNIEMYSINKNEKNLGTVKNANIAISMAHGELIKIIAADDALYDQSVFTTVAKSFMDSKMKILASKVMVCDAFLTPTGKYLRNKFQKKLPKMNSEQCFNRLCWHNAIIAGGIFYHKSFFEKWGLFDESYRLLEDWPMWLKITRNGSMFEYLDSVTLKYRKDVGVATSTNETYIRDRKLCFEKEIFPYRSGIGMINYLIASINMFITSSKAIRKIYGKIMR